MALKSTRSSRSSRSSTQNMRNSSRSSSNREPNARQRAQIGRQLRGLQDSVSNIARSRGLQWDSGSSRYNRINTRDQRQERPLDSETINSESLAQTKPIELPTPPQTKDYMSTVVGNNAGLNLDGTGLTYDTNSNQFVSAPQPTGTGGITQQDILNYMGANTPKQGSVYDDPEYQRQLRVQERAAKTVKGYTNTLNAITAKAQADRLSVIGQGRGIPEAIIGGQQAEIAREAAIQAFPVQAQLEAAQGNLELAQSHLDSLYKMKSEQLSNEYQYQMNLFNSVTGLLTKAEQRQFDEMKAEKTREYNDIDDFQKLKDSYAKDNPTMAASIWGARDRQDLARVIGTSTGINLQGYTPEQQADPFVQLLAKTKGGKPLTDTFAQSLNKGLNVLGQIGGLQTNIQDTNTGPLLGAFRGANPWDTNAQTIKAQLNAIVPNLARGVYGEVGVLTDNDVAQYSKTLPNLKSPEAVRNAVLGITVDLIGKSIKRTLEINAANGKDVSGFIDIYTEMNKTRDSIFSQIPGYKGSDGSASVGGQAGELPTTVQPLWSRFANWLYGSE